MAKRVYDAVRKFFYRNCDSGAEYRGKVDLKSEFKKVNDSALARRILSIGMTCVILITTALSTIGNTFAADSYEQLGTNAALGSPVLNQNFTIENWNKWEMVCWGVFLSNFCVPLVDSYDSAFHVEKGGSEGSGFKALAFGSGSDVQNNKTIQQLCDYAVTQQMQSKPREVYVTFTPASEYLQGIKYDPNTSSTSSAGSTGSTGSTDPNGTGTDPNSTGTDPNGTGTDPNSTGTDPNGTGTDPNSTGTDPNSTGTDPNGTGTDPNSTGSSDPNSGSDTTATATARLAKFQDFFFQYPGSDQQTASANGEGVTFLATNPKVSSIFDFGTAGAAGAVASGPISSSGTGTDARQLDLNNYQNIYVAGDGNIPTFWVRNGSRYIEILDYTNSWDVQMMAAMVSAVSSRDMEEEFTEAFNEFWDQNPTVVFDAFGNLSVDSKILFPAACNRNIKKDKSINVLNSWIFNGYNGNSSSDDIVKNTRQMRSTNAWHQELFTDQGSVAGGYPALSGKDTKLPDGTSFVYYDLDSIVVSKSKETLSKDVNYGEVLKELFDCDVTGMTNKYPIKLEVVNKDFKSRYGGTKSALANTIMAASLISNVTMHEENVEVLHEVIMANGSRVNLFSNQPLAIPVQVKVSDKNTADETITRRLMNFLYQCYDGKIPAATNGSLRRTDIESILNSSTTIEELGEAIDGNVWPIYKVLYPELTKKAKYQATKWLDIGGNDTFAGASTRVILLYPVSETMRSVGNILGLVDGTEFSSYSTMIYMTYLDWYGIGFSNTLSTASTPISDFDEDLFNSATADILNVNIGDMIDVKSDEELEHEILQYSYLLLSPDVGRSYRSDLVMSGISDFIYEQYTRIVYGTSSDYNYGVNAKGQSGFLAIEPFSENPATAWFLEIYSKVAVVLIAVFMILMVIFGLINSRKPMWFLVTSIVIVNAILLTPSTGELIPYITSNMVQKMFSSKMTYWSISEATTNATMEADMASKTQGFEGITDEEAQNIVSLVKTMNVVNLDRSLMVKRDISAKTTLRLQGVYTQIQQLQSTRWLLPMVMQQFSADDGSADYVYIQVANLFDDLSNLMWYYNPEDIASLTQPTATSNQSADDAATYGDPSTLLMNRASIYQDYVDTSVIASNSDVSTGYNYRSYAYDLYGAEPVKLYHTYTYLLDKTSVYSRRAYFNNGETYKDITSFEGYANDRMSASSFSGKADEIETTADQYDRTNRSTLHQEYGYLWATESPIHFFYQNIKQCFEPTESVGSVIGQIQGEYNEDASGEEVRDNFMYATASVSGTTYPTGYVRDVLDLQELFTNMVPYLYQVQLLTGGMDGNGGELVTMQPDGTIEPKLISDELPLYEGMNQSWLFRCNWAVKLMECPDYDKEMTISDSAGNQYKVKHPMLYEQYPTERPMVCSEAQMHAMGLKESDLNIVELKCIEVNKRVTRDWTMLLNYAGTDGITKEIIFRQMALDALLEFNAEFSPSALFGGSFALYPTTLDLRSISFDSVMKMLMINVSKDTSYIYGNTMQTLIENSDIVTAALLLIDAFICAYIIPFCRAILMAFIFYLGFVAVLKSLVSSNKYKMKVAGGQIISNLIFLFMTICYYLVFNALMAVTSSDSVLSVNSVEVKAGNPVWVLVVVLMASLLYIVLMLWQINFCFANYKSMGMEIYSTIISSLGDKITGAIGGLQGGLAALRGESSASMIGGEDLKGSGAPKKKITKVSIEEDNTEKRVVDKRKEENKDSELNDEYASSYTMDTGSSRYDSGAGTSKEIEEQIKEGQMMSDEEERSQQ